MSGLIGEGTILMFLGMGIVFVFLALLIFLVRGMSALVEKFPPPADSTPAVARPRLAAAGNDLLAVISAAVHQYRHR